MTASEQTISDTSSEAFWLFGYGSLIWKPPPHYDQRLPGYITGYVRRFWQESHDHRGTPSHPGRVVTLLTHTFWCTLSDPHPSAPDRVWGAAYHIPAAHAAAVRAYLDIREINGYSIDYVDFHASGKETQSRSQSHSNSERPLPPPIKALLYIGTPENPQFAGPQDLDVLAERIAGCEGPSGRNEEYLFRLEEALEGLGGEGDEHVRDLAERVRKVVGGREKVGWGERGGGEHDEEEEVER